MVCTSPHTLKTPVNPAVLAEGTEKLAHTDASPRDREIRAVNNPNNNLLMDGKQVIKPDDDIEVIEFLDSSDEEIDMKLDTDTDSDEDESTPATQLSRAEPRFRRPSGPTEQASTQAPPIHPTSAEPSRTVSTFIPDHSPVLAATDFSLFKAYIAAGTQEALHNLDLASSLAGISKKDLKSRLALDRSKLCLMIEADGAPTRVSALDRRLYELYIEWGTMASMAGVAVDKKTGRSERDIYDRAMEDGERLVEFIRALLTR